MQCSAPSSLFHLPFYISPLPSPVKPAVRTFEDAYAFVLKHKIVTIFGSGTSPYPSLWDHVDLPEKQPGEKGWGPKVEAIWPWKNQLPATFPDEIFYGKIKGGLAVLVEMNYLRDVLYPEAHKPVQELPELARQTFAFIRVEPWDTTSLRNAVREETGCSKSRFDTALKHLQVSLNIARSNDPELDRDTWLTFKELYPDIVAARE